MYELLRKPLFALPPETAHDLSLELLGAAERLGFLRCFLKDLPQKPVDVMGLRFPNPVGLSAGLDKNADYFNALGALGFGFVEVGTVTPRPQPGNPKPRIFRLEESKALINRMGFNNKGIDHLIGNVKRRRYGGILGINIGKNADTPVERAVEDYQTGFAKAYPWADYIAINVSSPNTPGLRTLQFGESLKDLLLPLKALQGQMGEDTGRYVPLAVKIAPDMTEAEIIAVADTLKSAGVDAVIAANTTVGREGVEASPYARESGGLSGRPVRQKSTDVIRLLAAELKGALPIIGVGGIDSAGAAMEKLEAGASLVQIYTGFIYEGPGLVRKVVSGLRG